MPRTELRKHFGDAITTDVVRSETIKHIDFRTLARHVTTRSIAK